MPPRPIFRPAAFWLGLLLALPLAAAVSVPETTRELLALGHELSKAQRYDEERALYEAWLRLHADDAQVTFALGYAMYLQASAEGNTPKGDELRRRTYQLVREGIRLGYDGALVDLMKGAVDAEGHDLAKYSERADVDAVMRQGEQAFAAGRHDEALKAYENALLLDPGHYAATLYIGDVHFVRNELPAAMTWFERATKLDPDRETAWRYWGDALAKVDRGDDALEKYVQALVAEPYNRLPRQMLQAFGTRTGRPPRAPAVNLPRIAVSVAGGRISVDQDLRGDPLLDAYVKARADWLLNEWPKRSGGSAAARHSLGEEAAGLRAAVRFADAADPATKAKLTNWDASVRTIKSLDAAGFLEAFILLDWPDNGIAADYADYRRQNRAPLLRYVHQVTLAPSPAR